MNKTQWTKERIQYMLKTNSNWAIRAVEVLYARQTSDEQVGGETRYINGEGFNSRDAKIFTSFYQQMQRRKSFRDSQLLSDSQLAVCFKALPKYWKQIKQQIEQHQTKPI